MKLNHPAISSSVKQEALAVLTFQQAQTWLCFSLGLQEKDRSPPWDKATAGFTHTLEKSRKHAAAGRQGVLTALVGFLDLALDLSFSGSPESSFFSGSFTTLRISLSGQREKKRKKKKGEYCKVFQCLAFFVITCFIYCLFIILHHTKVFAELLSSLQLFQSA